MEYLKVWTSFRQVISPLNDAEKGRLFDAMLLYAETGEEPGEFTGNERFLWTVAKQDIDRTAQKCEALRANASKGGLAKSRNKQMLANDSKSYQELANDSNSYQTEAKPTHNNNIKKDNIKKSNTNTFTPPTLEEVTAYCSERNNGINAQHFIDYYEARGWELKPRQKVKDWRACIRTWEQNAKERQVTPAKVVTAQQYDQRDYSGVQSDIERRQRERFAERLRAVK